MPMRSIILCLFTLSILLCPLSVWSQTAETLYNQAVAEKDSQKKIELFTKVIKKDPSFPVPYLLRGNLYLEKKEYGKADEDFNEFYKQFKAGLKNKPSSFLDLVMDMTFQQSTMALSKIRYNVVTEKDQKSVMLPAYIFAKARLLLSLQKDGKIPLPYTVKTN